jgi:hypothetical protein
MCGIVAFLVTVIATLNSLFPSLRVRITERKTLLLRWKFPIIFLIISLVFGIAWHATLPQKSKGELESRMVDQNKYIFVTTQETNHVVIFYMEIYNPGKPTIVRDWNLKIKGSENVKGIESDVPCLQGFVQRDLISILVSKNLTNGLDPNNFIFEKTRRIPIQQAAWKTVLFYSI